MSLHILAGYLKYTWSRTVDAVFGASVLYKKQNDADVLNGSASWNRYTRKCVINIYLIRTLWG